MLLRLTTSLLGITKFTRDITQAYVQSRTPLEPPAYIKEPAEMRLPEGTVFMVVRPLYGISKSDPHWYLPYLDHHTNQPGIIKTKIDPCFLTRHNSAGESEGIVALQVDDTVAIGIHSVMEEEEEDDRDFKSKERNIPTDNPQTFNGICLRRDKRGAIDVEQEAKIDKLGIPTKPQGVFSHRSMELYIVVNCRPYICANVQRLPPGAAPTLQDAFKSFKRTIDHLRKTQTVGLKFMSL